MAQIPQVRRVQGTPAPQPVMAPNWFLGLVPRELWNKKKVPFVYEQDFIPLAASQTTAGVVQIQADSHFLCIGATELVTDVANVTVLNSPSNANATGILCVITDSGSQMPLMSTGLPLESFFGTAQNPAIWPIPKLFRASGQINTQLQNLIATARNVRLSYWGIRIYQNIAEEAI